MDWYDPTCYASEILDAKYGKVLVDDVIDQLDHLNSQQRLTLDKCSVSILNYLMVLWEFMLTENSTLILCQEHCQSKLDHMLYQLSIWKLSKRG
jgi:hypothetical protein